PTYVGENKNDPPCHAVEDPPDKLKRVLVDSVASQANRQEEALTAARSTERIDFSDVYIDLRETVADLDVLSATEMPHRLSDAILRDSEIDGVTFKEPDLGKAILAATRADLSPLLEASPTTVLYGCWFSGWGIPNPLRLQRCAVADIWAENAAIGQAVGGRIDPLGIEAVSLYKAKDGDWTALEDEVELDNGGKPKKFGKEPSAIKHGNIPPSIHTQGITAETITLRCALPLAAVRRLRFACGDRDDAGLAYVVALALVARALQHEAGSSLRSRCDLISAGPLSFEVIDREGAITSEVIDTEQAIDLLHEAEDRMGHTGLAIHQRIDVKPSKKLKDLIAENRRQQLAAGEVAT
ncbi:MAG: type I-U CRISPR-associated RAMP protein Csb1/Cas7u, partial [Hyphomicrobiaceae bacterium]